MSVVIKLQVVGRMHFVGVVVPYSGFELLMIVFN